MRMTANYGLNIFWTTTTLFSVLSSCSSLEGHADAVCNTNVSIEQQRNISYTETYWVRLQPWCILDCHERRITRTAYRLENGTVLVPKQNCCAGYGNKNGTCRAKCSPTCMNGYCKLPNLCHCNHGWGGEHCHEPLLCSIAQSDYDNYFEAVGIDSSALENVQNMSENRTIDLQKLPACKSRCLDQLRDTSANITRSADGLFYFIPINSSCNTIEHRIDAEKELKPWERYDYVIGSVTVIILLLAMAVCIVCLSRRKRRTGNTKDNAATESEYDDVVIVSSVGIRPISVVDNVNTWEIFEYDDVGMQPLPQYDNVGIMQPLPQYDNVGIMQPIPEYDDVGIMQPIPEYDDVGVPPIPEYEEMIFDSGLYPLGK